MKNLVGFFNAFNSAVEVLRRRCEGDVSRLELLIQNDEEVRKTAGWLYFEAARFEELRSQTRYLQGIPPWFIDSMKSYKQHWAGEVDRVYGGMTMDVLLSDDSKLNGLTFDEIYEPMPSFLKDDVRLYHVFLPGLQRGAEAIETVMSHSFESNGLDDLDNSPDGSDMSWMLEGVEAWDFFQGEVGLDFKGIEARWKTLPRALVPTHLVKAGPGGPYSGVVELLNDAVSSYLVGALAAAVVSCRAIMEHLLKSAYIPHQLNKLAHTPTLEDIIDMALQEPGNAWMWKLNLHKVRQFANAVVHRPMTARWGKDADASVVTCLHAVRALIENAPNAATASAGSELSSGPPFLQLGFRSRPSRGLKDDPEDGTQGRSDTGAPRRGCLGGLLQRSASPALRRRRESLL